jgi:hypothetical protein
MPALVKSALRLRHALSRSLCASNAAAFLELLSVPVEQEEDTA